MRGVLAEYLVAQALGAAAGARVEWDACDVRTPDGILVEVKSAAFVQSWHQKRLSSLSFSIHPSHAWDSASNVTLAEQRRTAHVYVFCVLAHRDKQTVDPLILNQWDFYVLPTSVLNKKCPRQKTISLSSLLRLNPAAVKYQELSDAVRQAAANT